MKYPYVKATVANAWRGSRNPAFRERLWRGLCAERL